MSNNFHMLVAVESRESEEVQAELGRLLVDDDVFLARLKPLYTADALDGIGKLLKVIRGWDAEAGTGVEADDGLGGKDAERQAVEEEDIFAREHPTLTTEEMVERFKRPYLDRLYNLSAFVGEIKQRFSQWYNLRTKRNGPLWEDRFKSVLVQGEPGVLAIVAAYIDSLFRGWVSAGNVGPSRRRKRGERREPACLEPATMKQRANPEEKKWKRKPTSLSRTRSGCVHDDLRSLVRESCVQESAKRTPGDRRSRLNRARNSTPMPERVIHHRYFLRMWESELICVKNSTRMTTDERR